MSQRRTMFSPSTQKIDRTLPSRALCNLFLCVRDRVKSRLLSLRARDCLKRICRCPNGIHSGQSRRSREKQSLTSCLISWDCFVTSFLAKTIYYFLDNLERSTAFRGGCPKCRTGIPTGRDNVVLWKSLIMFDHKLVSLFYKLFLDTSIPLFLSEGFFGRFWGLPRRPPAADSSQRHFLHTLVLCVELIFRRARKEEISQGFF